MANIIEAEVDRIAKIHQPLSEQVADKWADDFVESGKGEQIIKEVIANAGMTEERFVNLFAGMSSEEIKDLIDLHFRRMYH